MRRMKLRTAPFYVSIAFLFAIFYVHLFHGAFPLSRPIAAAETLIRPPTHHNTHQNQAIRELLPPVRRSPQADAVLLPDWELLLLLPPHAPTPQSNGNLSCLFHNNAASPAVPAGTVPSSARAVFRCAIPPSVRRLRPLYSPRLVDPSSPAAGNDPPPPEMIRWNRLAYESISTPNDVILFVKGINKRGGVVNAAPTDLRCAFLLGGDVVATTPVMTSAQEVFRCAHPVGLDKGGNENPTITITLDVGRGERRLIPSLAIYRPPTETAVDEEAATERRRSTICACTMVYNVAKFLPEWVMYHSGIGVDRFVLYDNGSEDELESVVSRLGREGYNVTTRYWPWTKTQEAGFSHCAAVERGSCTWMMFTDVDEFVHSPTWSSSGGPDRSMLAALLPSQPSAVGQVALSCRDFGPSGQRAHPSGGVTQGYTCRRRAEERHKSLVRLEAVADGPLVNSVHHFGLDEGWETKRAAARAAVVNHYKYQAWEEFKVKFRRRVSAYVVDWREAANQGSKDRTPGLGVEPVEPENWAGRFCEVEDTGLRETARRWFGSVGPTDEDEYRMAWEKYRS